MIYLSNEDYYEVYLKSIITDYDRETLTMLYQPIIGGDAVAIYLSLYSDYKKENHGSMMFTHQDLFISTGFNVGVVAEARKKLEGIGLLRAYYKKENDQVFYKYLLFAPKTPQEFFDDILFKGLLIEKIGEKNVQALVRKYKEKKLDLDGFDEITESFRSVFNPILTNDSYETGLGITGGYGRKTRDVSKGFDLSKLTSALEEKFHIIPKSITKTMYKKISDIALLYGIEEEVMADLVSRSFNPNANPKVDLDKLKALALEDRQYQFIRTGKLEENIAFDTDSKLGKKINIMSTTSALDYLTIKQNNGAVSPSDIKLITDLQEQYGLTSAVINPLIDYCLEKNHNTLSKTYVTKVAAAMVRENIQTTLDAMNYLIKSSRRKYVNDSSSSTPTKTSNNQINTNVELSLDELLSEVD